MIRRIFFITSCLLSSFITRAQNNTVGPDKVILPAPDVAAIQRYGNWPLGSFTGTANIDIPLFNVTCGKLSFPVHLSYGTSGIKTNDAGSNIGIGWALNATGVINRNMMGGIVDEHPTRGYWVKYPFHSANYTDPYDALEQIEEYAGGLLDGQPDIFYYSAGQLSGKFMFDTMQNVHLFPYQNYLIEKQISNDLFNPLTDLYVYNPISGFVIIDENGTSYQFKDYEWSGSVPWTYTDLNINPDQDNALMTALSPSYIHTWYLTNIISADKADTIHFSYTTNEEVYNVYGGSQLVLTASLSGMLPPSPLPGRTTRRTIVHNDISQKVLDEITYRSGYIKFYQGANRLDMSGAKTVDSIVQYDYNSQKVTGYHLGYSYLQDTSFLRPDQVPGGAVKETIRLFLSSIQQAGMNGASLPPYLFSYEHSRALPSKIMGGGDLWGLANGKVYNGIADSITGFDYDHLIYAPDALMALKTPDFNYAKQGVLTNIVYPTGGSTDFVYEPHYKDVRTRNITTQVCDGNQNIIFTGVDFNPGPHGGDDPDAPGPRKFFVTDTATFDVTVSLDSRYSNFPAYYYIEIRDSATNTLKYTYYNTSLYCDTYTSSPYPSCVKHLTLNPGTYLIIAKNTGTTYSGSYDDIYCKLSIPAFNCRYVVTTIEDSVAVAGLRLKETIDDDPVTGSKLATLYEYGDGVRPNWFTGNYLTESNWEYFTAGAGDINDVDGIQGERTLTSNSTYALSDVSGSYICYGNVKTTKIDLNSNRRIGYTINYYSNDVDDGLHEGDFSFSPYPPYIGQYWKRGKLIRATQYKTTDDGQSLPVQDKVMSYSNLKEKGRVYGDAFYQFHHLFQGSEPSPFLPNGHDEYLDPLYVKCSTFYYPTSYQVLDGVTVKDYDDDGNYVETKTIYQYDTTTLLQKSAAVSNSKGEWTTTNYLRPFDLANLTGTDDLTKGVKMLQDSRVLAAPVEVTIRKSNLDGSNSRTVGSVFTSYKPDKPLRDKIYVTEKAGPMTDFVPATVSGGHLTMDSRYQSKVSFDAYDNFNNLSRQHKVDDINLAYIWDYQYGYPVAEVRNAIDSNIAYTSFEADNAGNWTIGTGTTDSTQGITGGISYALNGTISKSGLTSNHTYIVSYWTRNTTPFTITGTISGYPVRGKTINNWTLYVHKVTGQSSISISGTGRIDELRLYPDGAQMATYTFKPLVGMTSSCDIGNRITYYEYDGLQRLKRIRDQDYNIIKTYEYQYQGSSGCGSSCYILTMQTMAGTSTLGYPVGVFNVHGKLLGNADSAGRFVSLWNADTADSRIGTLAKGGDPLHFNITLNTGQVLPSSVTGCRYYQVDLAWDVFDGIRNTNGVYVDFGDGIGMKLSDTLTNIATVPANTTYGMAYDGEHNATVPYYIHSYADTLLKTITIYHNDDAINDHLDDLNNPATSLTRLRHFRGNLPQNLAIFGGSCYQQASMNSIDSIRNWSSIHGITYINFLSGDGINPCRNMSYTQDFMQYNKGLQRIKTTNGYYRNGYRDTTFKLTRLKNDWNTYFTGLQGIAINDDHWNREDLSALRQLNSFTLVATTQNHQDDPGSPLVPIPKEVLNNVLIQIAAGAGQTVRNGVISMDAGGSVPDSTSATAVQLLQSKGWSIYINGVLISNP